MYQHFTHWGEYKAGISHGGQWPQGPTLLVDGHLRIPPKLCIPHPHSLISLHFVVVSLALAGLAVVGLHPAGLQALRLPSLKTEEQALKRQQRYQQFGAQGSLMSSKQGAGTTPHCAQQPP